ncbi:MAG: hypothetical protein R2712_02870 [Vicinamibacterales bacterium]
MYWRRFTSPLTLAHAGVKVFVDRGVVYPTGARLRDQRFDWGYGAGVFLNATVFRLGVDLGWREGRSRPNATSNWVCGCSNSRFLGDRLQARASAAGLEGQARAANGSSIG